jgi:septum formation protein
MTIRQPEMRVILASASPRRREILEQTGLIFDIIPANIDESFLQGETSLEHVCRLAEKKGDALAGVYPEAIVISADTIVVLQEQILGKPRDEEEAYRILKQLSGKTHEVISAFALTSKALKIHVLRHERTQVHFRNLSDADIKNYIAGGSPMDKAGAYGIQDLDFDPVKDIEGCYYNVMGFPLPAFMEEWNALFP